MKPKAKSLTNGKNPSNRLHRRLNCHIDNRLNGKPKNYRLTAKPRLTVSNDR
jgi:hypothetical protein